MKGSPRQNIPVQVPGCCILSVISFLQHKHSAKPRIGKQLVPYSAELMPMMQNRATASKSMEVSDLDFWESGGVG